MTQNKFYTPQELAKAVNAHHLTILRLIQKGEIKAENVGGRYLITESDAKKWAKKHAEDMDGRRLKIDSSKV